ncbi:MAG: T9SS type A sorting domain-containing protein [Phaeodactylibacter sp.]|nr:T9SS type A sorting domain-containing protein [Phaeodactylibacter sp.]
MRHLLTLFLCFYTSFLSANTCSTAIVVNPGANWQGLTDNQFDNQESWYVITPSQNGTLEFCRAAGYVVYDGCTFGDPTGQLYPSATATFCTVGIEAPLETLPVFAGNSVYIRVQAGIAGSTVYVRFVSGGGGANCSSTCYENSELSGGQVVQCDNFESYPANQGVSAQQSWRLWSAASDDANVRFYNNAPEKYLHVERTSGSVPDVIYSLGNRTSGRYRLSWTMLVVGNRSAYYNILHTLPDINNPGAGANWAYEVVFNSNGGGQLIRPGSTVNFSYTNGGWNRVMQIIDMDNNVAEFWINDQFVDSWTFSGSISSATGVNRLAGVNFFAFEGQNGDASNFYAIDNICLWEVQGCTCPLVYDPVCVKNGVEYGNSCAATCFGGYISAEWNAGACGGNGNVCQGTPIQCGQTVANQTTVDQSNDFNTLNYANCQDIDELFGGNDKLYEITITQRQQVKIFLDIQNNRDLDLFLLDECTDPHEFSPTSTTNCIAASYENNLNTGIFREGIDIILDPGTYFIVVDGKNSTRQGAFELSVSCDCSCSEPAGDQPVGNVSLCDNLEDYNLAAISPQSTRWRLWSTGADDGAVILQGDNQVLQMEENGPVAPDVLYLLDNLNTGRYRLSWQMWVDSEKAAYYNIQHSLPDINSPGAGANWAYEVFFNPDGTGILDLQNQDVSFNYINGSWNNVMQIIDIDQNRAELWINHRYVASWNFSEGSAGSSGQLAAINFFANDNNSYLIDDICLWEVGVDCNFINCQEQDPVCGLNNIQYACAGRARCEGYISSEWERCFSICDYGGTFVYRSDGFTDTMRVTDLAPPLLRQEPCIQNSYDGVIPDNFYADIYIFYNDNSDDINVTDLLMGDNTKFFVFSCDCTGADCTQTCLGEVGNGFSGDGLPEGFYYIVATNTETEAYGFAVFPNGDCASGLPTLNCSDSVTGDLNTADPDYDTGSGDGFNAYGDCYNGARPYTGGDDEYRFVLDEPGIVSISLETGGAAGVFLYNYLCARNCLGYAETGPQGGLATLDSFPLTDGVYYLIVDKAFDDGQSASYALTLNCQDNDQFFFAAFNDVEEFVEDCPPDQNSTHQVTIPETAFTFTQQHRLSFLALDNGLPRAIEGMSVFWNGAAAMAFDVPEDLAGDNFKCAYEVGDKFQLFLSDLSGSNFNGSLCDLEFQRINTGGATADSLFMPGETSLITSITRREVDNARLSSIFETVPAQGDTFNIQVLTDQNWTVTENPEEDWLRIDPTSSDGSESVRIEVDPNPFAIPRRTLLQFKFEGGITTFQFLAVEQLGVCATPQVSILSDAAGNQVCFGETVTLTAQIAPPGQYDIEWSSGGSSPQITVAAGGDIQRSVTVTENNCFTSATADISIQAIAPPAPPVSMGNEEYCQGQALPVLQVTSTEMVNWYTQPQGGAPVGAGLALTPSAPGTYYAEAVTAQGCASETRTAVTAVELPTPTADAGNDAAICSGSSVTLSSSASGGSGSGYTYGWSGGLPSVQNPTASPVSDITYMLTVTDGKGCTDTDEVTVTVNGLPQASIQAVNANCGQSDGSATAIATGGAGDYSFAWSDGQTGPTANGLAAGPISVTVTDGAGCMATASVTISDIAGPAIFPMNSQEICAGETATLQTGANSGTGPYTFTWNQGLPNGPVQTVSPGSTTTYQATVADANGCLASTTVLVTVHPLPVANAGDDREICSGEQSLLQASASGGTGDYVYHWNNSLGFGAEKLVSPLATTTYTITITDEEGCSDTDEVMLSVNPLPAVSITKADAACGQDNGSAVATATGGAGPYTFEWSDGQAGENATGLAAGSYSVTATDTRGCTATATVAISDQAGPVVNIPGVSQICRGDSANLIAIVVDGNGPFSYNWNDALGTNNNIRVAPTTTRAYSVTVTDANNCVGVAQVTVPVAQRATVNAGPNQSVCLGEAIQLNGQIGGGAASAEWDALIAGGTFSPGPDALDAVYTPPAGYTGPVTFALMVEAEAPCPAVLSYMAADIKPLPALEIDGGSVQCEPGFNNYGFEIASNASQVNCSAGAVAPAGPGLLSVTGIPVGLNVTVTAVNPVTGCENTEEVNSPICECEAVVSDPPVSLGNVEVCEGAPLPALQVEVDEGETAFWYATPTGGDTLAENTTSYQPDAPGSYYAARFDLQTLCETTARVEVSLSTRPLPVANAGEDQTICPGDEATLQAQEEEGYAYEWSTGATTAATTVSPATTQTYTVTVTADGCSAEDMVTVAVTPDIEAAFVLQNALDCFGDTDGVLFVNATGGAPPLSYEWNTGDTLPSLSGLSANIYTVTITDQEECETTESFEMTEPSAITETAVSITADTNGIGSGAIDIEIGGGSPPYAFTWTGQNFSSSQEDPSGLREGEYFLEVRDSRGCAQALGPFTVPLIVGLEDKLVRPAAVQLFPNPTTGRVWASVSLPRRGDVQLEAFNPLGERILRQEWRDITERSAELDFSAHSSGVYLVKITYGQEVFAKRLIVQQY